MAKLERISRSIFNVHATIANPNFVAQHQLSLVMFRHAYKWFPLTKASSLSGTYEIDPLKLQAGYAQLRERKREKQLSKKQRVYKPHGVTLPSTKDAGAEVPADIRTQWYIQPSVSELTYSLDNAVSCLGTKVTPPTALLEMSPPQPAAGEGFDKCYHAAMQYYKELLTRMFHRPVHLVTSYQTEFGVWDASFIAYYLRHVVEENLSIPSAVNLIDKSLGPGKKVRSVRHFDGTAHYVVRAWRVFMRGRFHMSPFGRKEATKSIKSKGDQVPVFQIHKYVDYFQTTAISSQGVVGIKVWIYLDVAK